MRLSYAEANTNGLDLLPFALKLPNLEKGTAFYFLEDNKDKIKAIQETLLKLGINETSHFDSNLGNFKVEDNSVQKNGTITPGYSLDIFDFKNVVPPQIEFKKINPTKYRLRIHGAKSNFPLIFSETYHNDWRLYLVPLKHQQPDASSKKVQQLISSYRATNKKDQASSIELVDFIQKGWISDLEKKEPSKINPYNFLVSLRKTPEHQKTIKVDFISKNFARTIQNNNLPNGEVEETWFYSDLLTQCFGYFQAETKNLRNASLMRKKCQRVTSIFSGIPLVSDLKVFLWPELLHWKANSFANSWWISPESIKKLLHFGSKNNYWYSQNPNGSIDFEMVIEFWPQHLFYWGILFSLAVFVIVLSILFIRYVLSILFVRYSSE